MIAAFFQSFALKEVQPLFAIKARYSSEVIPHWNKSASMPLLGIEAHNGCIHII